MINIELSDAPYFNLQKTVLSHGWGNLAPFYWDPAANTLECSFYLSPKTLVRGLISQKEDCRRILFRPYSFLSFANKSKIRSQIERMLSLKQDIAGLKTKCIERKQTVYLHLIKQGWGRILRAGTGWEDAVKTICTTNASWPYTQQMCKNLCSYFCDGQHFPSPEMLLKAGKKCLSEKIKLGYRNEYIFLLAEAVVSGRVDFRRLEYGSCDQKYAEQIVRKIKGLGPYGANHLLVLLGWHCFLPIDREVMRYLKINRLPHGRCPKEVHHYSAWGDYRFVAYKLDRISRRQNWIGN